MEYELLSKLYYKKPTQYKSICEQRKNSEASCILPMKIHENQAFYVATNEMMLLQDKLLFGLTRLNYLIYNKVPPIAREFYIKSCLVDEVNMSNSIEGVFSTRREILDILDKSADDKKQRRFEGLVLKYQKLLSNMKEPIELRYSRDVRAIYDEIILPELDKEDLPDGELFRKESVSVMSATQKEIHKGITPESRIISDMDNVLNMINDESIPYMVRIAISHYYMGYIHPFYDGNGRLCRFISSYLLQKRYNPLLAFRLSYSIKGNKRAYYKAFDACNDEKNYGDVTPFVLMFMETINNAVDDLLDKLKSSIQKLKFFHKLTDNILVGEINKGEKLIMSIFIQNALFASEGLTIEEMASVSQLSINSARYYIRRLVVERGFPIGIYRYGHRFSYRLDLKQYEKLFVHSALSGDL